MLSYLNSVDLGVGVFPNAQSAKMDQLTITLQNAKDKFDTEDQKAGDRHVADPSPMGSIPQAMAGSEQRLATIHAPGFGSASDQLQRERDNCSLARSTDAQPGLVTSYCRLHTAARSKC
jgi:hypothetical protein